MGLKLRLIIFLLCILFFSCLGVIFASYFKVQKLVSQLSKLNLSETTLNLIKNQKCNQLLKEEKFWIVKGCREDVYFKIFLQNNGYYLGYCTSFSAPREAFLKLKKFFDLDCLDLGKEDIEITSKVLQKIGFREYDLCGGRQVIFQDECILSVK
jgi:hypothetical protein